jgi:hypothetical protein
VVGADGSNEGVDERRQKICAEILSTEESYIRGLTTLDRYYRTGFASAGVKEKDQTVVFSTIAQILALHNDTILPQLQLRCTPQAPVKTRWCVAQVFIDFLSHYHLYSSFVNNYETALRLVAKLRKEKKQLEEVFDNARVLKETNGLDFFSLYITIVQRLPRYLLLLEDLRKHTPDSEKEYQLLNKAITNLSTAATEINERKAAFESMNELAQLANEIGALPIKLDTPGRRLVASDELRATHGKKKPSEFSPARFWLFNDCVVVARRNLLGAIAKPWKVIHFSFLVETEFIEEDAAQNIVRIEASSLKKPLRIVVPPPTSEFISRCYIARSRAPKELLDSKSGRNSASNLAATSGASSSVPSGQLPIAPVEPQPTCTACILQ